MLIQEFNSRLFFLHIPKTAGMSLRAFLKDQFSDDEIFPFQGWEGVSVDDLYSLDKKRLVMGHFDARILAFMPADTKTITFLREPIRRTVSALIHAMSDKEFCPSGLDVNGRSIEDLIHDEFSMRFFANNQTGLLSNQGSFESIRLNVKEKLINNQLVSSDDITCDIDSAIENIRNFSFVGIVEQFREDIIALSDKCYLYPPKDAPLLNANGKVDSIIRKLGKSELNILKNNNELDIELYSVAREINRGYHKKSRNEILENFMKKIPIISDGVNILQSVIRKLGKSELNILKNNNELDIELYSVAREINRGYHKKSRNEILENFMKKIPIISDGVNILQSVPFYGWGFNESETSEGNLCRWSGPSVSSGLNFKVQPDTVYYANVVAWFYGEPFATQIVSIYVNNYPVEYNNNKLLGLVHHRFIFNSNSSGNIELELVCNQVATTSEDKRSRGFIVSAISVSKAECMLNPFTEKT